MITLKAPFILPSSLGNDLEFWDSAIEQRDAVSLQKIPAEALDHSLRYLAPTQAPWVGLLDFEHFVHWAVRQASDSFAGLCFHDLQFLELSLHFVAREGKIPHESWTCKHPAWDRCVLPIPSSLEFRTLLPPNCCGLELEVHSQCLLAYISSL